MAGRGVFIENPQSTCSSMHVESIHKWEHGHVLRKPSNDSAKTSRRCGRAASLDARRDDDLGGRAGQQCEVPSHCFLQCTRLLARIERFWRCSCRML